MEKKFWPNHAKWSGAGSGVYAINLERLEIFIDPQATITTTIFSAQVLKFQDAAAVASSSPSSLSEFNGCNMTC